MGQDYILRMQVIAKRTLKLFWAIHPDAETPLSVWYGIASKAEWASPADVKQQFGTTVDFVGDNRVVFDIGGNKYRMVCHMAYRFKRVLIKFVGTHKEYDKIDVSRV